MSAGRPSPRIDAGRAGDAPKQGAAAPAERPRVLVWFDYSCAFCYVDWFRFARMSVDDDVEVMYLPFELRPEIAAAGISAAEHGLAHSEHVVAYLKRQASAEGIDYREQDRVPNTHLALLLGEAARDAGESVHRAVHLGVFRALFGRGADIGDREILLGIAEKAGMERAAAEAAWTDPKFEQRLHAMRHLAMAMGVKATPSALVCNELIIGSRPAAVVEQSIERCLAGLSIPS